MLDDLITIAQRDAAKSNGPDVIGSEINDSLQIYLCCRPLSWAGKRRSTWCHQNVCLVCPTAQMSAAEDAETECRSFW